MQAGKGVAQKGEEEAAARAPASLAQLVRLVPPPQRLPQGPRKQRFAPALRAQELQPALQAQELPPVLRAQELPPVRRARPAGVVPRAQQVAARAQPVAAALSAPGGRPGRWGQTERITLPVLLPAATVASARGAWLSGSRSPMYVLILPASNRSSSAFVAGGISWGARLA